MKTFAIKKDDKILRVIKSDKDFDLIMDNLVQEINFGLITNTIDLFTKIQLNDYFSCSAERVNDCIVINGDEDHVILAVHPITLTEI